MREPTIKGTPRDDDEPARAADGSSRQRPILSTKSFGRSARAK